MKAQLLAGGLDEARISPRELALTTLNSKLRVDDACEKYITWLDAIQGKSTEINSTDIECKLTARPSVRLTIPSS